MIPTDWCVVIVLKGDGYGNGTWIYLSSNLLTRFESTVYQSVLEKMAPYSENRDAFFDIFNSNEWWKAHINL